MSVETLAPGTTTAQPARAAQDRIVVESFTTGLIGPSLAMLGPVRSGGTIVARTAPGCWGPMITPRFRGGHEVTQPVAVEGAEVGDAIALKLRRVEVTSIATSSGVMKFVDGRYVGDPFVAKTCPNCGAASPSTHLEGIGQEAVHCDACGAEVSAFRMTNGYVIVFDKSSQLGVTVPKDAAERIARNWGSFARLPPASEQHSILAFAEADIVGLVSRMRPFMGNIGTTPSRDMPDSHNAGDFGGFLVNAPHQYGMSAEDLARHKTDGHMDANCARAGAIVICPVKVAGGGVYLGDMHAQQGNGEIAVHTTDVAGEVELQVEVVKGLALDGPILLQRMEDLPPLARPLSRDERDRAAALAANFGGFALEDNAPLTFIGSGANLNEATTNGLERAAAATGLPYDEILNRATIAGSIEIARLPGVARVTLLCPMGVIERMGIAPLVREQYGL